MVWFPDGVAEPAASDVTLPVFGALFLIGAVSTVVAWHDDFVWTGVVAAAWALTIVPLALTVRAGNRRRREREAKLERGVFLLDHAIVLTDS